MKTEGKQDAKESVESDVGAAEVAVGGVNAALTLCSYLAHAGSEMAAQELVKVGLKSSIEEARELIGVGQYPYDSALRLAFLGGVLMADGLLRMHRNEGLLDLAYSQLKKMPQYFKTIKTKILDVPYFR